METINREKYPSGDRKIGVLKIMDPAWLGLFLGIPGFLWGFFLFYQDVARGLYGDRFFKAVDGLEMGFLFFIFVPLHGILLTLSLSFLKKSTNKTLVANIKAVLALITLVSVYPIYFESPVFFVFFPLVLLAFLWFF